MYIPIIRNYREPHGVFVENGRQDYPLRNDSGKRIGAIQQIMQKNGDLWAQVTLDECTGLCSVQEGKNISQMFERGEIEFSPVIEFMGGQKKLTAWEISRKGKGLPTYSEKIPCPHIPLSPLEKLIMARYGKQPTQAIYNENTDKPKQCPQIPLSPLEKRIRQVYGTK